ncbi:hypothetical protein WJX81_003709 [Elliptochloris bilobata]|uniref:ABC transporter domain-containing protein n=1 Tax=Elliptochloris bilobata TaxID=381761 RepID=A0AAW1S455_9CHLO
MVSDSKKKREAAKKAKAAQKAVAAGATAEQPAAASNGHAAAPDKACVQAAEETANGHDLSERTVTGVLSSHPLGRDIHYDNFSLLFHGHELLADTRLELNFGRRYALIGPNGSGKSSLLKALGHREFPIPEHIDTYFLDREAPASDLTALEAVMSVDEERSRLEREAESLVTLDDPEVEQRLIDVYERLEGLDAGTTEARAGQLLHGLGFTKAMQSKRTRDFSGGWRMRIALARALFVDPTFLILDEPTNHLDLEACVWLEETLKKYKRILLMVSHSQDFMNGVATNTILVQNKKLRYYGGNYDTYVRTRTELEENQMKQWQKEQDQIASMKDYVARFGHGSAKLARQAQSKEKVLAKMVRGGLTEKVKADSVVKLFFTQVGKLPPPVLQFQNVTFGYSPSHVLYQNVDLGVDLDSRVALVGPNGTGKSTLLKLMTGDLEPLDGMVKRHNHLKIGWYHQHLAELLDLSLTPLEYMFREFPEVTAVEEMRKAVGRFGISGKTQTQPMAQLSDGLRSRVVFAWLAYKMPHLLLLDEPTNHLDIETIDSLARAINGWDGGLVLVSHDFRLISQVAEEIWVVAHKGVTRWRGGIEAYKEHLKATHAALKDQADLVER